MLLIVAVGAVPWNLLSFKIMKIKLVELTLVCSVIKKINKLKFPMM